MKLAIVANCQVQPYAAYLGALPEIEEVVALPVNLQRSTQLQQAKQRLSELLDTEPSLRIVTFNLDDTYGELSTAYLKTRCEHVKTLTNIYFEGLQPDCTYLADMGNRIPSPLGDYHSRIVIHAFLKGRSVQECIGLFNAETYARAGYFNRYEASLNQLRRRDAQADIPLSDLLDACCRSAPALLTFNHPTSVVFTRASAAIADSIGLFYPNDCPTLEANPLSNNVWFPVFPEIAAQHGFAYSGNYLFKTQTLSGGKFLSLQAFVAESYRLYDIHRDALSRAKQVPAILSLPIL